MQVISAAYRKLTLKHTKAHIQAQDSHIPAAVSQKHKQERVRTHRCAFLGQSFSAVHMLLWPRCLWVRELW